MFSHEGEGLYPIEGLVLIEVRTLSSVLMEVSPHTASKAQLT
jgi:hypothetical protein